MKRYRGYKDSRIEWIGGYPESWQLKKVSQLFLSIGSGTTPASDDETIEPSISWLNSADLTDGLIFECKNKVTSIALQKYSALKIYPPNSLVMAMYGATIGKLGITQEELCTNQACCVLGKPNGIKIMFAFYCFLAMRKYLLSIAYGGGQPNISQTTIKSLKLCVPNEVVQENIITYLDHKTAQIDSIIADKEKLIALLKEKRQAIISDAVTRGLDPTVPMKDSGVEWIGQIPAHWEMSRIGFETWVRARLGWKGLKAEEYVENGFAFLSTPNIKSRDVDFDNVNFITQERYEESPEIKLQVGDVLLAKDGSTLGTVNVIRKLPCEATVNSSIAIITPNNNLHSVFLKYLFESYYLKNFIQMKKDGMGVPHLFQADIIKFPIPVPPIEEQNIIYQYLDKKTLELENLIAAMEQQLALFREYRQSAISEAVTGKIMVAAPQSVEQAERPAAKSGGANVHFKRRVLAAKILDKLCGEPTLGHVKLEKLLFLSEYCAELDMHTKYVRHAAGPYSPKTLRSIDTQLQKAKWFLYDKNNRGSKYRRLDKSTEYLPYFDANFSAAQNATVERLVELFRTLDTERCEIVATLYGAWNDFLIDGCSPTDEQIADEVLTHWSEEKKRIDKDRWLKAIGWMRKHQIVPCGYGEKTKRRDN